MAISAAKSMLFGSRGSNATRPMYTKEIGGAGGGGGLGDLVSGSLGKGAGKAGMAKQLMTLIKNPKLYMRALKMGGGLSKIAGGLGSLVGGVALDAVAENRMEKAKELQKAGKIKEAKTARNIGKGADIGSLALTGAGIGGTVGSIVPGVGTAIGAGVGGAIGAGYGAYKNFFADAENVHDFIVRPGTKQVLKANKGDYLFGSTNKPGTGTDVSTGGGKVEALIQELIAATKENTAAVQKINVHPNVYLGTNKLNESIGLNLHPMR